MIWLNLKELENKISKNELSERDGFNYVLAFFILCSIALSLPANNTGSWFKFLACVISVVINVWGLNASYNANKAVDGKDFFKRFFAINWVVGMRLLLVILVCAVMAGFVIAILSYNSHTNYMDPSPMKDVISLILMTLFTVICYLLIINSFQRLKPKTE